MLNAICYTVRAAVTLAVHFDTGDYWRNRLQGPISTAMVRNDIAHNTHGRDAFVMDMRTRYPSYKGTAK